MDWGLANSFWDYIILIFMCRIIQIYFQKRNSYLIFECNYVLLLYLFSKEINYNFIPFFVAQIAVQDKSIQSYPFKIRYKTKHSSAKIPTVESM